MRPEANYTQKISLCGSLTSRKKKKGLFHSKKNTEFDKAELSLYEEVTLMKPFRRKTLVLIGASGSSRRALKHRILNGDPDQVGKLLILLYQMKVKLFFGYEIFGRSIKNCTSNWLFSPKNEVVNYVVTKIAQMCSSAD